MFRLTQLDEDYSDTLDQCIAGISGNPALKAKMLFAKKELIRQAAHYSESAQRGRLYQIAPLAKGAKSADPIVVHGLVRSELINLYEYYFCNEAKQSRRTYDKILNLAREQCPFCGGVGSPRNLDHFLPKAAFPQFATFPINLVPSCRDCNMDGKAAVFASTHADQLIQPYVDNECFFSEQWIHAEYVTSSFGKPATLKYFVEPPDHWPEVNKARACNHFATFDLARRYGVKASQLLRATEAQIAQMQQVGLPNEMVRVVLLIPGIESAPFLNHWQTGFFKALYDKYSVPEN